MPNPGTDDMKLQSSLEFLSSYSFLLILITLAISAVVLISAFTRNVTSAQCAPFGGVSCSFADFYYNSSSGNSLLTLSIANAQDAPLNISNISISISNVAYIGSCAPRMLYQGSKATCAAILPSIPYTVNMHTGFYTLNARYCAGIYTPGYGSECTANVIYRGTFTAYQQLKNILVFSVAGGLGNSTAPLAPYQTVPAMPSSYTVVQNGEWTSTSGTFFGYAYGSGTNIGLQRLAITVFPFPQGLSMLGKTVACSAPYNSMLSTAYTILYVPSSETLNVSAYTNNAIEVYYKAASASVWASVFGGTLWSTGTAESNSLISFSPGLYDLAVEWSNGCGIPLQAFRLEKI